MFKTTNNACSVSEKAKMAAPFDQQFDKKLLAELWEKKVEEKFTESCEARNAQNNKHLRLDSDYKNQQPKRFLAAIKLVLLERQQNRYAWLSLLKTDDFNFMI